MNMLESSQIGDVMQNYVNEDFTMIAALTFFICEAIFAAFPVQQARMKQLTSLITGAVLGVLLSKGAIPDALIRGLMAGGATTIGVAKFKKPSTATVIAVSPDAAAALTETKTSPTPVTPLPEPVEHL